MYKLTKLTKHNDQILERLDSISKSVRLLESKQLDNEKLITTYLGDNLKSLKKNQLNKI